MDLKLPDSSQKQSRGKGGAGRVAVLAWESLVLMMQEQSVGKNIHRESPGWGQASSNSQSLRLRWRKVHWRWNAIEER